MGNEQGRLGEPTPAGIQSMDENLQKKFSKGIQYNMKIVVRGDRNTGKSCLFQRMEGKAFQEAYIPTNEIQVTSILWSYRVTNDTVKVEIWDVVDEGRSQKKSGRGGGLLKMFNNPEETEESDKNVLDAGFLDVYKGAHGVVFLYDITKQWTWQYIERELPKVPFHLPVMILGNFRDMGDHRVVSREVCSYYIEHMDRPEGAADVRYAEGSMKNGFGLMHLHKFLSIPFLQLQQETLLQQLQVNREQTLAAREELDSAHRTEDQNYDLFEQKLERIAVERGRRRTKSIEQEPGPGDESPTTPRRRDLAEVDSRLPGGGEEATDHAQQQLPQRQTASPSDQDRDRKGSFKTKLTSKLSGFLARVKEEPGREVKPSSAAASSTPPMAGAHRPRAKPTTKVEDFVPEGDVDDFFEDDEEEEGTEDEEEDSDEDAQTSKPQITMDEDLSSPEEEEEAPPPAPPTVSKPSPQVKRPPVVLKSAKDIELTESEEEEETPDVMADEDFGDADTAPSLLTSKKTKDVLSGELVPAAVEKKKKESKKSSGLMLEFNLPSPTPPQPKKTEEKRESPKGTPDVGEKRRDSKSKKKSKRSRHGKEEAESTSKAKSTGQQGGGGGGGGDGVTTTSQAPVASDDPFGPIAALDAWLNSDTTEPVSDILQPSKVESKEKAKPSPVDLGEEIGEEEEEEGEESPETQHKKTKKHKHHHKKHHHRDGGEEGAETSSSSSSRKKHRHHHKSSRHGGSSSSSRPSAEALGEYNQI